MDLVELDDAYKYNWVIGFSIFRLLKTEHRNGLHFAQ
ncbi:hypothetical protein T12_3950 [Trichinella patagoniensis]|uniref:Uncharacterized protein n=1 Tax=Trichinella patagoniensis TaxID=990121 RepID=A0A0V0Z0F8_9BILA|nr:hypothetical protein T12_3950 [Trichinella patagoniensis]